MTVVDAEIVPGVYDIPEHVYHADPVPGGSLSSSGARRLLETCPARFRYEQSRPRKSTKEFDLGHAAHRVVLGAGADLVVVDAKDWRTKAAQEKRDQAYAEGKIPALRREYQQVQAMVEVLRAHPIANALFSNGQPEQAMIWQDPPTGIWRRALVDWLPDENPGRLILVDYKTCQSANPDAIQKSVYSYGYHQQAAWYVDGAREIGLDPNPAMVFVFQEKQPPYLITVIELDHAAMRAGRRRNREAIDLYARCKATGVWPGYADDITLVSLPAWAVNRDLENL